MLDLSGLAGPHKIDYLHQLWSAAGVHREAHGFPHWVIYDEAHLLGSHEEAHWTRRGGYVLSSFAPAALPAKETDDTDVVLEIDNPDTAGDVASRTLRRASVRFGAGAPRAFTIAERRTAHVRHRHKYADVSLPKERRFYFRPIDGQTISAAGTMGDFSTAVGHLDPRALQYHLERGDFSRWLDDTIADKELAAQVAVWEDELPAHRSRGPGANTSPASPRGAAEVSRFTRPRLTDRHAHPRLPPSHLYEASMATVARVLIERMGRLPTYLRRSLT